MTTLQRCGRGLVALAIGVAFAFPYAQAAACDMHAHSTGMHMTAAAGTVSPQHDAEQCHGPEGCHIAPVGPIRHDLISLPISPDKKLEVPRFGQSLVINSTTPQAPPPRF